MENLHIEELNTVPEFEGNVLRIQHTLQRARREKSISINAVFVGSLHFSFSGKNQDGTNKVCSRTYSAMAEELGCSKASIARAIAQLRAKGYLERVSQSGYVYKGKNTGFDRIEFDMLKSEHKLKNGRTIRFTKSTAEVFAYLYTNKDNDGQVTISASSLADKIGSCRNTVERSLRILAKAGYISRPAEDKGKNRFKSSTWHISKKLLNRRRKSAKKNTNQQTKEISTVIHKTQAQAEAEARTERAAYDSFNAMRRQRAEALADMNERVAMNDRSYSEATLALRGMKIELAFAELHTPSSLLELRQKQAVFMAQRAEALSRLKLDDSDFIPRYECTKCKDTGYSDSGGICPDCWKLFKSSRNK